MRDETLMDEHSRPEHPNETTGALRPSQPAEDLRLSSDLPAIMAADKFLATPPNGLTDLYVTAGYARPNVGPFAMIGAQIAYHTYDSDRLSLDYGNEINAQLQAKWDRYMFTLKYADYDADAFATDTQKLWLQVEFAL